MGLFAFFVASTLVSAAPFQIVATDDELSAPASIAAGTRHVIFTNRSSRIHEAMFVKLPRGMSAGDYEAQVKRGVLFP